MRRVPLLDPTVAWVLVFVVALRCDDWLDERGMLYWRVPFALVWIGAAVMIWVTLLWA